MRASHEMQDHPERLIDRALSGELDAQEQAMLARHLACCPDCEAELEAARVVAASVAPGSQDDALNRAAVENALARLRQPEGVGERLWRWFGMHRLLRPAAALAVLGAVAVAATGIVARQGRKPAPPAIASPASPAAPRPLVLADGSEVAPVEGARVQIAEQTPARTTVSLLSGAAQFRIRHDSRRIFRVDAGPIQIEDLGTVFSVDHQAGSSVRVAVSEGRVAVLSSANRLRVELRAGEDRLFPSSSQASPPSDVLAFRQEPPRPAEQAVALTGSRGQARVRGGEDPADLLLAADIARRSRRPQAAVAPLRRLVERYPKDPRAPSAAFTLGWVLLTDLGRAREAATAFADAERIAPRGTLAEDAAARVAEAWQKAGDLGRAAQAARHYERAYPSGRYMALMRGLVGEH